MSIIFYQNFILLSTSRVNSSDIGRHVRIPGHHVSSRADPVPGAAARGLDTSGPVTSLWGSQTVESPLHPGMITQCDPTVIEVVV